MILRFWCHVLRLPQEVLLVARGVGGQTLAPDSARPAFALEFVKRPRPQSDPVHQRRKTQNELRKGREDGGGQGVHRPPVRRALRALRQESKSRKETWNGNKGLVIYLLTGVGAIL